MPDNVLPLLVQFNKAKAFVLDEREKGFSRLDVFRMLKESGEYSGSYSHFTRLLTHWSKDEKASHSAPKEAKVEAHKPSDTSASTSKSENKDEYENQNENNAGDFSSLFVTGDLNKRA